MTVVQEQGFLDDFLGAAGGTRLVSGLFSQESHGPVEMTERQSLCAGNGIVSSPSFTEAVGTTLEQPFDNIFPQPLGGPDAELSAAMGFDPVTHRNDNIQVVVLGVICFAVRGSYPEIPDN